MEEMLQDIQTDIKQEALGTCYGRFDLVPKVVGAFVGVGGGMVLQAIIPGVGPWIAVSLGMSIAGGGLITSARDGASIEAGELGTIRRYLDQRKINNIVRPYLLKAEAEKKPLGTVPKQSPQSQSGTPEQSNGNPSDSAVPIPHAIAQLDDAAPHLFMVGKTREGKSETLKHLIGSEQRVWYLTSKATDKVPEHWQGYRVGGPQLVGQINWLLDQWEQSFLNHLEGSDTKREWFVIDEAVGILQSLKTKGGKGAAERLRGFIVEGITAGAAVNAMVGILSQTGNSGPIGIDLDLLQNFSCVACGKKKKPNMIDAFTKLTGLRFTPEQEKEILSLKGYWQLWENDGPCLSQVPLSTLPLKSVAVCPIPDDDNNASPKANITPPLGTTRTIEDRVLSYLLRQGEAKTIRDVVNNATWQTGKPRPSTDQVKDVLAYLASEGKVQIKNDDSKALYRATVT